jgi:hypothetical protein
VVTPNSFSTSYFCLLAQSKQFARSPVTVNIMCAEQITFLPLLATFAAWRRDNATVSAISLASAGFQRISIEDKVACPICGLQIAESLLNEQPTDPLNEHTTKSPSCPLAMMCSLQNETGCLDIYNVARRLTDTYGVGDMSVPVNQGERDLHDVQITALPSDVAEMICVWLNATSRWEQNPDPRRSAPPPPPPSTAVINWQNPDFDRFKTEMFRLGTFVGWPEEAPVSPLRLAADGWFFTGENDCVQCAFCRGKLRRWTRNDTPSSAHSRFFPFCPFIRGCDVGNVPLRKETVNRSVTMRHSTPAWTMMTHRHGSVNNEYDSQQDGDVTDCGDTTKKPDGRRPASGGEWRTADDVTMAYGGAGVGQHHRWEERNNEVDFGRAFGVRQQPDGAADAEVGKRCAS